MEPPVHLVDGHLDHATHRRMDGSMPPAASWMSKPQSVFMRMGCITHVMCNLQYHPIGSVSTQSLECLQLLGTKAHIEMQPCMLLNVTFYIVTRY